MVGAGVLDSAVAGSGQVSAESVLALLTAVEEALHAADPQTAADAATVITRLMVAAVPGVQQASITVHRCDTVTTLRASGEMAARCEQLQRGLRCGPGIDALSMDASTGDHTGNYAVYRSDDLAAEDRWPAFSARAVSETGVGSLLVRRLYRHDELEQVSALSLYSEHAGAFDDTTCAVATALAIPAARVLALAAHRDRTTHLQRALTSNREIGTAMGVLMATRKVTREGAFTLLRTASQNSNCKLSDLASHVVDIGELDVPADIRRSVKERGTATNERGAAMNEGAAMLSSAAV